MECERKTLAISPRCGECDSCLDFAAFNDALGGLLAERERRAEKMDELEMQIASTADFLNTCLRESSLDHAQVGVDDLRPGIDALYLRLVQMQAERDKLREALDEARVVVAAYYETHVEDDDPACPCEACVRARAVFARTLAEGAPDA